MSYYLELLRTPAHVKLRPGSMPRKISSTSTVKVEICRRGHIIGRRSRYKNDASANTATFFSDLAPTGIT